MRGLRIVACSALLLGACSTPSTVHITFSPAPAASVVAFAVDVAVLGSDAGVAAATQASDLDLGVTTTLDLTVTVPDHDVGRCVTHAPTDADPPVLDLGFTYRYSIGAELKGTVQLPCRQHDRYEATVGLAAPGDDGATWRTVASGTSLTLDAVWGDAATGAVFVGGASGTLLRSAGTRCTPQPDCARFAPLTSPTTLEVRALWGLSATQVFAAGSGGLVLVFDGNVWAPHPMAAQLPTDIEWLGVWASSAQDLWLVGQRGTAGVAYHFDGSTFSAITPTGVTPKSIIGVWGLDGTSVYAITTSPSAVITNVGMPGGLRLCQTLGTAPGAIGGSSRGPIVASKMGRSVVLNTGCTPMAGAQTIPTANDLLGIWASETTADVFVVGLMGDIWRGLGANAVAEGGAALTIADLQSVSGVAADDVYAVGTGGVILHRH